MINKTLSKRVSEELVNPKLTELAQLLGNIGWGVPSFIHFEDFKDLQSEELDNYFLHLFESNFGLVQKDILECSSYLSKSNQKLLEELIEAYSEKYYHITVAGMFPLIEGALANFLYEDKQQIRYNDEFIVKRINSGEYTFLNILLSNINKLLDYYFKNKSFNGSEPSINRHWTCHGRYVDRVIMQKDCLKLFSFLSTTLFVASELYDFELVADEINEK